MSADIEIQSKVFHDHCITKSHSKAENRINANMEKVQKLYASLEQLHGGDRMTADQWSTTYNHLTGLAVQVKATATPTSLADGDSQLLGKRLHKEIEEDDENIVSKVVTEEQPA